MIDNAPSQNLSDNSDLMVPPVVSDAINNPALEMTAPLAPVARFDHPPRALLNWLAQVLGRQTGARFEEASEH